MAVRWADPEQVASAAENWSAGQRECRLMGSHSWLLRTTVATRLRNGNMQVRQTCARRCGVYRVADMNKAGYLVSRWDIRYDEAKAYLLHDDKGKSIGRVNEDGRAFLWREAITSSIRIVEVEE